MSLLRQTFGNVKASLRRVAGQAGLSVADDRLMAYTNEAQMELMNEGDWASIIDRYNFLVYGGKLTLPAGYERLLGVAYNEIPMQLQSPWFEFVGWGLDLISELPSSGNDEEWRQLYGVLDRDQVCLFRDIPAVSTGQYTLVLATSCDERVNGVQPDPVIIEGLDGNYEAIRSANKDGTYINGVQFDWYQGGPFQLALSPQVFSGVTKVIKPVTREPVNCYMVPVGGSAQTQIGRWGALETFPSYRRYQIHGLSSTTQYCVKARMLQDFVPITTDNDFLQISNLPALKSMVQAINFQESQDIENYASYKANAVMLLKKEMQSYIGLQRTKPLITFGESTGVRGDGMYIL